jgi:hypothetical protein
MDRIPDKIERFDSGTGSLTAGPDGLIAREVEIKWLFQAQLGYEQAEETAIKEAPLYYSGHKRTRLDVTNLGSGWYEATAGYGNAGINQYEDTGITTGTGPTALVFAPGVLSFDTTGGSEHITQAWTDTADPSDYVMGYATVGDAPDLRGAINANAESVQGVDITVPSFQFTETWMAPASYLIGGASPAIKKIYEMTGKVNKTKFRTFEQGEVLFLGARLDTSRSQTMVAVTFSFAVRLNRIGFDVGGISDVDKYGWDYMWVEYETISDSDVAIRKPRYVYVARVYEHADFTHPTTGLGIGTDWPQVWLDPPGDATFTHPLSADQKGVM